MSFPDGGVAFIPQETVVGENVPGTVLVHVRWFDSAIYSGGACQPEDLTGVCENESAGLLVKEDDREIVIALDRCLDTKDIRLVLCIPRTNVRSVRRFKV